MSLREDSTNVCLVTGHPQSALPHMPLDAHVVARLYVALEHAGETVLNSTFNPEAALDRAERFVFSTAGRANLLGQTEDAFVVQSYCVLPLDSGPRGLLSGAIAFMAPDGSGISASDVVETKHAAPGLPRPRWCILDVRIVDPTRVIPATILNPYPGQPGRRRAELEKTDMLPLWFWQSDGSLGIPITAHEFTCLPEKATRIRGTSLKVGFWWRNYGPLEKQIRLRTTSQRNGPPTYTPHRQLASSICKAVQRAMAEYERNDICVRRTQWQDLRWRIGTEPGCISVRDVILLGIVYVSPGRVMPLLRV